MEENRWLHVLGWGEDQLHHLRMVGFSFLEQGHYHTAQTYFEALIILDPTTPYHHQVLAGIYLQTDDNQKALQTCEKALQLDPFHAPTQLNRAKALLMLGKRKEGIQAAKQLERCQNESLANDATALILSYAT